MELITKNRIFEFINNLNIILKKKQKKQAIALVFLMIISALLEVCSISSVLPIISSLLDKDFMYTNVYAKALCNLFGISNYNTFVIVSVSILLFIYLLKDLILIIKSNFQAKFALEFQYELRQEVFHKYLKKDYSFYFDNNSSEIFGTLMDDIGKTYASFDGIMRIVTDSIINLFLIAVIFIIDFRITFGMIIVMGAVFLAITKIFRPYIRKRGEISHSAAIKRNQWIYQALQGIKTVKVTEKDSFFENRSYKYDLQFSKAEQFYLVLNSIPKMIIEFFSITVLVILIVVLVISGNSFTLLIPKIGAIAMAVLKILPGINSTISNIVSMQYRMPAIQRISSIVLEEEPVNLNNPFPTKYINSIEASKISFRYDIDSPYILKDASLSIPIGKMIGIVGASGEGKTTFADILLGLLKIENGNIFIDGTDIYQNICKWRESIGYITQSVFLLDDTIKANIAFGIEDNDISEKQIWDALEKAQLADFVRSLPEGIESKIGEKGVKLSGGQCQRIGIARALYNNPQILIFDEATSSLDNDVERDVVDAINSLYGKHTIIVIAHRSVALERCDEIYQIKKGKFILKK